MKILGLIMIAFIFMVTAGPSFSEEQNYCHDQAAALEWEALIKKAPEDWALQRLHALRLGICQKISTGNLSLRQEMKLFEQEREKVLKKWFEEGLAK